MINNFSLIAPLLNFTEPDDFFQLYIFKRKKDQPEGEKDNHQSVRTIKTYAIESLEYLEKKMPEIIQLCELFRARAYIHVNKLSHKDISLIMLERLAKRIREGVIRQEHLFDSVVGEMTKSKLWIVDIDTLDGDFVQQVKENINSFEPVGNKILATIPTRNGYHLITQRFNTLQFKNLYPDLELQKTNPTLLFLPDSLN